MANEDPKIEEQDTSSPIEELQKRMEDIEMSIGVFNPRNLAGLRDKDLSQATRANLFGDGSDGDVVVSTEINLAKDMFYNNLTVESGGIINTKSFRIFVKDQFIKKPGGIVRNSGNNGAVGTTVGGAGGTAIASGSLPGGLAGGAGGYGYGTAQDGFDGIDAAKSLGSAGSGGGGGGNGIPGSGWRGGAGGDGGSQTGTIFNIINSFSSAYYLIDILPTIVAMTISAGSGGGGGGGAPNSFASGGGAGSTGAMIWIAANRMFIEGTTEIRCNGGNGGNGAAPWHTSDGGGGGGAGAPGGVIILIYGEKTGTGTLSVAGGSGGTGGTATNGYPGSPGTAGQTGKTYLIQIA